MQSLFEVFSLLTTVHSFCIYGQLELVPVVCQVISLALYNVDIFSRQTVNADGVPKGDGLWKGICDKTPGTKIMEKGFDRTKIFLIAYLKQ